jgi:hypothetical protein
MDKNIPRKQIYICIIYVFYQQVYCNVILKLMVGSGHCVYQLLYVQKLDILYS